MEFKINSLLIHGGIDGDETILVDLDYAKKIVKFTDLTINLIPSNLRRFIKDYTKII